ERADTALQSRRLLRNRAGGLAVAQRKSAIAMDQPQRPFRATAGCWTRFEPSFSALVRAPTTARQRLESYRPLAASPGTRPHRWPTPFRYGPRRARGPESLQALDPAGAPA